MSGNVGALSTETCANSGIRKTSRQNSNAQEYITWWGAISKTTNRL